MDCLEKEKTIPVTKIVRSMDSRYFDIRIDWHTCVLTILEQRRKGGDLIKEYKIITGKEVIDHEHFQLSSLEYNWRGHCMKLLIQRQSLRLEKYEKILNNDLHFEP